MLLRIAQRPLVQLLLIVLFASLLPPASLPILAAAPRALHYGPAALPSSSELARPVTSAPVPQMRVTPANQSAHAALPPVQRPIGQRLPLTFVSNTGQSDAAVRFQARGMGGSIFFTPQEVVLAVPTGSRPHRPRLTDPKSRGGITTTSTISMSVVRLQYEGTTDNPTITPNNRLPGTVNYLLGKNPSQWRTNLPTYTGIVYEQLYPGIDAHYDGTDGHLKSTYVVAPGAAAARIRWRYQGAKDVQLDASGNLIITLAGPNDEPRATAAYTLTEQAPIAWQNRDGRHIPVPVRYLIENNRTVTFSLGTYDSTQPLIIDPTLDYSTYLGGSSTDDSYGIAVDLSGNSYVTGWTVSSDFPTVTPPQGSFAGGTDAFVTKLSADGQTVLYSTYLGGSSLEFGYGIAVDAQGNAYISGDTWSTNFPLQNPLQATFGGGLSDVFVAKLNPVGAALLYSTYLGGSRQDGGSSIAIDSTQAIYLAGYTISADFPTSGTAFDSTCGSDGNCDGNTTIGFHTDTIAAKLSSDGQTLLYSTYLGGAEDDTGMLTLDTAGNVYITGDLVHRLPNG